MTALSSDCSRATTSSRSPHLSSSHKRERQQSTESNIFDTTKTSSSSLSASHRSDSSSLDLSSVTPAINKKSIIKTTTTNATQALTSTSSLPSSTPQTMHHSIRQPRSRKPKVVAPKAPCTKKSQSPDDLLLRLTDLVLADLGKDSKFMPENEQRSMPSFEPGDVAFGPVLGHGEFGIVLEVQGLKCDEKCTCFKCTRAAEKVSEGQALKKYARSSSLSVSSDDDDDDDFVVPGAQTTTPDQKGESQALPKSIMFKRCPDTPPTSVAKKHHRRVSSQGTVTFAEDHAVLVSSSPKSSGATKKKVSTELMIPPPPPAESEEEPDNVTDDKVKDEAHAADEDEATAAILNEFTPLRKESTHIDDNDEEEVPNDDNDDDDDTDGALPEEVGLAKARMSAHWKRHGSSARYAVKHLRDNLGENARADAVIDLACEAAYLSRIVHSNVVRLRATVGTPGTTSFMLIMDRLVVTLQDKLLEWKTQRKRHRGSFLHGILGKRNTEGLHALFAERLMAVFDIARALRYLHRKSILYRDIKPENIGVDVRGDMRIFDFGLAKELKPRDLVESPEDYNATGLTGSRRYMAPEVVRCVNYGYSADVYSFSILFWQVFSLETPFERFDAGKHFDKVVIAGKRPHKLNNEHLPSKMLHRMMEDAWSDDRTKRPTFHQICQFLQAELTDAMATMNPGDSNNSGAVGDRTAYLMNRSYMSMFNNSERAAAVAAYKEATT